MGTTDTPTNRSRRLPAAYLEPQTLIASRAPNSARCVQRLSTRQFLISTGLCLPDDSIAKRIVQTSLRIHEDDMVVIDTWQHTIDLASDIALECLRTGAKPLITLMKIGRASCRERGKI